MQSYFIMIDLTVVQVLLSVLSDSLSSHGEWNQPVGDGA